MDVSVIVPIHNGAKWINGCFESILQQTAFANLSCELCVCNDSSTDETGDLLLTWTSRFEQRKIPLKVYTNESGSPGGVGYSKNRAVEISVGQYLCFQDIDDIMLPQRIQKQYEKAASEPENTIVGSRFKRNPDNSTNRYTRWANNLSESELNTQVYTSHGPTVIMPTWFCHRSVYFSVGGFSESGKGTPEDLIFFYRHLDLGGKISRVDEVLLIYNYHLNAETFSIHEDAIWNVRIKRLEEVILTRWTSFTIWNAGKQGRKFFKSLSEKNKKKVTALCDVDLKKIGKKYTPYDPIERKSLDPIEIVHFKDASPPFVICVKLGLTGGEFETNLASLKLTENEDYVYFS